MASFKSKLLLIGGGGHCRSCIDVVRSTGCYDIVGILDVADNIGSRVGGVEIIGSDSDLGSYINQADECLITVGQVGHGELRKKLFQSVRTHGGRLATIVSPSANVAESTTLGEGTIVMHNAVVNTGAKVAENVILNSMSLVEHDASIGAHSHISTRATINGGASIGEECFIGSHAIVFNQCDIGHSSVVSAAQVVRRNIPKKSILKGAASIQASPVFVIAEAGVNHNGDQNLAMQMIEVAATSGADAVKFQTFRSEDISTDYAEKAEYQKANTARSESQKDMLKALELPEDNYAELVKHCAINNIEFMSTAFDIRSMNFLLELGIQRIKIPSGELTNVPFLRHCAKQKLPIILSTGMATFDEIVQAKSVLLDAGLDISQLSILHCNTAYPTPFEDANLSCITTLSKLSAEVGYSDHTLGDEAIIASIALGARIVEKHFTLDRNLPGPDQSTSLEPEELNSMVSRIRHIEQAMGDGIKAPSQSEIANIAIARKSIVASEFIKKGEVLSEQNLTTKRPGNGMSASLWDQVIGQVAPRDYVADEQIDC